MVDKELEDVLFLREERPRICLPTSVTPSSRMVGWTKSRGSFIMTLESNRNRQANPLLEDEVVIRTVSNF